MTLIDLEKAATLARRKFADVAHLRYSLDPEQVDRYKQARAATNEASTAYRREYIAWERAVERERDRQEWARENAQEQIVERW